MADDTSLSGFWSRRSKLSTQQIQRKRWDWRGVGTGFGVDGLFRFRTSKVCASSGASSVRFSSPLSTAFGIQAFSRRYLSAQEENPVTFSRDHIDNAECWRLVFNSEENGGNFSNDSSATSNNSFLNSTAASFIPSARTSSSATTVSLLLNQRLRNPKMLPLHVKDGSNSLYFVATDMMEMMRLDEKEGAQKSEHQESIASRSVHPSSLPPPPSPLLRYQAARFELFADISSPCQPNALLSKETKKAAETQLAEARTAQRKMLMSNPLFRNAAEEPEVALILCMKRNR